MIKVGTAELKNKLSKYLAEVRKGVSVIVTDHGKPIAKLSAIDEGDGDTSLLKITNLVNAGLLTYNFSTTGFDKHEPLDIGGDIASRMVIEDRD